MKASLKKPDLIANFHADGIQHQLAEVAGMEFEKNYLWHWHLDGISAAVTAETGSGIRIMTRVASPPTDKLALESSRLLPGNLRYATGKGGARLIADAELEDESDSAMTLAQIRAGLMAVLAGQSECEDHAALAAHQIQVTIDTSGWPDDRVVTLDEGWEFRPRLCGEARPADAHLAGAELRLHRLVVDQLSDKPGWDAACAQALRFNEQLRHARLVMNGDQIVAETRLHAGQLTASWLASSARAVAVASSRTTPILRLLAAQAEVAELYSAVFFQAAV